MAHVTQHMIDTELDRAIFMVVGLVNVRGEARTAGVTPAYHGGAVWFSSLEDEWKTRHLQVDESVSATVTVPKRIPLLPIRIPPATITFSGKAEVMSLDDPAVPSRVRDSLSDVEVPADGARGRMMGVRITPTSDIVTYGIGVPVWKMRDTELSRGRVAQGHPGVGERATAA